MSNCGAYLINIDGVNHDDNESLGALIVRNYDNNGAPRQKITLTNACSSTTDWSITCNKPTYVKLYDAATGGNVFDWNTPISSNVGSKDLWVEGVKPSTSVRDIRLHVYQKVSSSSSSTLDCSCNPDYARITVLWVEISGKFSGDADTTNSSLDVYRANTNQTSSQQAITKFLIPLSGVSDAFGTIGMQLKGDVKPSDLTASSGWTLSFKSQRYRTGCEYKNSDEDDGCFTHLDDTFGHEASQDNVPNDAKIFDTDAPGLRVDQSQFPVGSVRRHRVTFENFFIFGNTRVSEKYFWYFRGSTKLVNASGSQEWDTSVTGDNETGQGTTSLTWNLT